jgi:iron complex outermembrane receptor protein/vitamin B12 transporter
MPDFAQSLSRPLFASLRRTLRCLLLLILLAACTGFSSAASIRGVVTDANGGRITGATVVLLSGGKAVGATVTGADGSFQMSTGIEGRFFLMVSGKSFRQLETPSFYAGRLDSIERSIVLEPEWVRESIVVTATGTPTPQPQTSEATSVLGAQDLALRDDLTSALRLMPGTVVVQEGQMGAQSSLFIRGGNSDANKILLDGIDAGDMGNQFDFGPLSTTAVEHAEVYRGPDSNLYGAGAGSGVVSLTTPRGTTSFPSILFQADGGSFLTHREELELAGARGKLDYLGVFSWLQTENDLPHDEYHVATAAANFGYQLSGSTQLRGTLHYGVDASGVPNAWDFYHVADDATQKDQDLFISASVDNQTTTSFHNLLRYGATRKREQETLWQLSGTLNPTFSDYCYGEAYFGNTVKITGANGYSAIGQAVLDCKGTKTGVPNQYVNNRDQLVYQGDYRFTQHLNALIGFHYENERGSSSYDPALTPTNYVYLAAVHGDYKNRFYYTLSGSLEKYNLFGLQTSPHAGLSYALFRPRKGVFNGTRILFNFGKAVREPKLTDEASSLYTLLENNGGQSTIQQMHLTRLGPPATRSYEGGVEQDFLANHLVFHANYFHNEFTGEIEYVGLDLVPELLPNLTPAQQQSLENTLQADYAYELTLNSEAFRAQGIEATIEGGIGHSIFLRGGYTYLDAVVQHSYTNDDVALLGPIPTFTNGIPIGPYAPLQGARPFRRPPHTGFLTASYNNKKLTGMLTAAFASRSDDSTYLEDADATTVLPGEIGGNSLLLPNRNLDWGYAKLDLSASYKVLSGINVYLKAENLTDSQHIAPIGYPSLPITLRAGLRIEWTKAQKP